MTARPRGVPMPPETEQALEILAASMADPETVPRATARARIEKLADQIEARANDQLVIPAGEPV